MADKKKAEEVKSSKSSGAKSTKTTKRLYRPEDDRVIAGVASGLARYFDIDPVIVRILFVVMVIWGGSGVILYIALWLLMPTESSTRDTITTDVMDENSKELSSKAEEFGHEIEKVVAKDSSRIWIGIAIVAIGSVFLFQNFGFLPWFDFWKLWPLLVVAAGVILIVKGEDK